MKAPASATRRAMASGYGSAAGMAGRCVLEREIQMGLGPDNRDVSMADVQEIEDMAKAKLPTAEIARRKRLPYWRIAEICLDARISVRA